MSSGFFSRVTLLPRAQLTDWYHQALRRGEVYRDHAVVWRLFPGDGFQRDFLFRAGGVRADGHLTYYVVSRRRPSEFADTFQVECKEYQPSFDIGDRLAFSLRANPTVSRGVGGARSKRHDVLMDAKRGRHGEAASEAMEAAATRWIADRIPGIGLEIEGAALRFDGYRQHRCIRTGQPPLQFSSIDFHGVATVRDPARLAEALFTGIGHSKGFGCGLLLVRRAS
jgi:CRISPR system Cascade subunit CasE